MNCRFYIILTRHPKIYCTVNKYQFSIENYLIFIRALVLEHSYFISQDKVGKERGYVTISSIDNT